MYNPFIVFLRQAPTAFCKVLYGKETVMNILIFQMNVVELGLDVGSNP